MYCTNCGAEYVNGGCPNGCNNPQGTEPKKPEEPKKSKKLRGWQIALIVVGAIITTSVLGNILGGKNSSDTDTSAQESSSAAADTEPADTSSAEQDSDEPSDEDKLAAYETVDFATLARNPDSYKGQKFVMTGEVIQVQEPTFGKTVQLRINVTKKTYESIDAVNWTDTIFATVQIPKGDDRILEGDIITFYGVCDGLYTYTSVLGQSVSLPKIDIDYWNLAEK